MTRMFAVLLKSHLAACWSELAPYRVGFLLCGHRATPFESHLDSSNKDVGDLRIYFHLIVYYKIRILGPGYSQK